MMVVEGIGRTLDPDINLISSAWPTILKNDPKLLLMTLQDMQNLDL